jgi:glutamate-1-semialdehyde 2,1-aminomutase
MSTPDRARLAALTAREQDTFAARTPKSAAAHAAAGSLFGRVPMTWMNKTAAGYPVYAAGARGARVTDVDGHEYVDFCLGDTGAMAGHSPAPVVAAVTRRLADVGGATTPRWPAPS